VIFSPGISEIRISIPGEQQSISPALFFIRILPEIAHATRYMQSYLICGQKEENFTVC